MSFQDEITKVAYELYEKSGRIDGRNLENWIEAERIVQARRTHGDLITKVNSLEGKARDFIQTAKEGVKVTLHELRILTKKVFE